MTELETLKAKKKSGKITANELTRLKMLQDGEPLSASDLAAAKQREADRLKADKETYDAKQASRVTNPHLLQSDGPVPAPGISPADPTLDVQPEHPRIQAMKQALMPFTQIEAHDSRPNEFVLFTRGISITAGDVRKARKAMKL